MTQDLFIDESGYTGEDLFGDRQPVFVLAGLLEREAACRALKAEFFGRVRSVELKHATLAKRSRGQRMMLDFLRHMTKTPEAVRFAIYHKRFGLVAQMVDCLIEPPMYEEGLNLYEDGGHIALANVIYHTLRAGDGGLRFFDDVLQRFQEMMRQRKASTYARFFLPLHRDFGTGAYHSALDDMVVYLLAYHIHPRLGLHALRSLPHDTIDPALTNGVALVQLVRAHSAGPFLVRHDRSSAMTRARRLWDALVSPSAPPAVLPGRNRNVIYPLNIVDTLFEDSRNWAGLQLCDILAGAMARRLRWHLTGRDAADTYGAALADLPWERFETNAVWPDIAVTPDELGTRGVDFSEGIQHAGRAMAAARPAHARVNCRD